MKFGVLTIIGDTRAVDTQIKRLRKKLGQTDSHFEIKMLYGVGYKFEVKRYINRHLILSILFILLMLFF